MALLRKDNDKVDVRGGTAEAALSIIAAGMHISGDVETNGTMKIDGRIDGSVLGARQVMLGRHGTIHGNLRAGEVVVGGLIDGAIVANERLELQASAVVNGDIDTKSIVVLEGARINGAVRMQETQPSNSTAAVVRPASTGT
ncbi:MAG: polymer-forming cytoskeletal protein [Gemmatimonadota bacterium]